LLIVGARSSGARSVDAGFVLAGDEAVLEAVAGAVDVVEEPVEDRGGEDFVAEDLPECLTERPAFLPGPARSPPGMCRTRRAETRHRPRDQRE